MDDLLIAVDEWTDPADCEYVGLSAGGIIWTSPAIAVPFDRGEDDDADDWQDLPWAEAELSDYLGEGYLGRRG
jgi:hypothetical protein